nr:helicase [Tanacetum cinerariifolium]
MNSGNNHADRPSLSNILHTSVMIHLNIIIRRDGNVKSFWCLKLSDIGIPSTRLGTSSIPTKGDTSLKGKANSLLSIVPFPKQHREQQGLKFPTIALVLHPTNVAVVMQIYSMRKEITKETEMQTQHSRYAANKDKIRVYNGMFCFTSFRARIDHSINVGMGLYTFRINGQNYHRIGSLLPKEGTQHRYAQLWFFDTHNEIRNRLGAFMDNDTGEGVNETLVGKLIKMLDQNSAIAKAFRMARNCCHSHTYVNMELRLLFERTNSMQYNLLTITEVAALITKDFGNGKPTRDIIVNKKDSGPKRISELHPSYMALQYPLLFL